jgi:hypothetical protein
MDRKTASAPDIQLKGLPISGSRPRSDGFCAFGGSQDGSSQHWTEVSAASSDLEKGRDSRWPSSSRPF